MYSYEESKVARKWRIAHRKLKEKLPRRAPVVYGNVKKIVKQSDGTFIIPPERPATTRTIRWKETLWATSEARVGNMWTQMQIPVGTVDRERTKKVTSFYDYDELKKRLEAYEELVRKIEEDKMPEIDKASVKRMLDNVKKISVSSVQ